MKVRVRKDVDRWTFSKKVKYISEQETGTCIWKKKIRESVCLERSECIERGNK